MRIVIITQDDPFYLGKNLDYLFNILPADVNVVGCVVTDVSPFGKKESLVAKALKTIKIFGVFFFVRYAMRFLRNKFSTKWKVSNVLAKHGVPIIKLSSSINSKESLAKIRNKKPDLLISIAGNEIFKKALIDLAPKGCINLHSALLPKYRGLMPSFWVLKNKEKETGVSVFFVDKGIDSGPILTQKSINLTGLSQEELIKKSKRIGMEAIVESIEKIMKGDYQLIDNPDEEKSYYGFPDKSDVKKFREVGAKFY